MSDPATTGPSPGPSDAIVVRVGQRLLDAVDAEAERLGMTRSEYVRHALKAETRPAVGMMTRETLARLGVLLAGEVRRHVVVEGRCQLLAEEIARLADVAGVGQRSLPNE